MVHTIKRRNLVGIYEVTKALDHLARVTTLDGQRIHFDPETIDWESLYRTLADWERLNGVAA